MYQDFWPFTGQFRLEEFLGGLKCNLWLTAGPSLRSDQVIQGFIQIKSLKISKDADWTSFLKKLLANVFIGSLIRNKNKNNKQYCIFTQERQVEGKCFWQNGLDIFPLFYCSKRPFLLLLPFAYLPLVQVSLPLYTKCCKDPWHESCINCQTSGSLALVWAVGHLPCCINIKVPRFLLD